MSHQQSFSYKGTALSGVSQYCSGFRVNDKLGLMCLAQGHNAVTSMRLESAAPRSRVKHSTTEPLRSLICVKQFCVCSLFCDADLQIRVHI